MLKFQLGLNFVNRTVSGPGVLAVISHCFTKEFFSKWRGQRNRESLFFFILENAIKIMFLN